MTPTAKKVPRKQQPGIDALAIFFEHLTEEDERAIERGRKEVDYLLEPVHKLLDYLPPDILEDAADAIEFAIEGGEANGFRAGFYYALRLMQQAEGLYAAAARYYEARRQEQSEPQSGQA